METSISRLKDRFVTGTLDTESQVNEVERVAE